MYTAQSLTQLKKIKNRKTPPREKAQKCPLRAAYPAWLLCIQFVPSEIKGNPGQLF